MPDGPSWDAGRERETEREKGRKTEGNIAQ